MKKRIWKMAFMAMLCLITACKTVPNSSMPYNDVPSDIMEAFLHPQQAMLYSVQPYPDVAPDTHHFKKVPDEKSFYGRPVLGKVFLSNADEAAAFNSILKMAVRWNHSDMRGVAACFNPRHGITILKGEHVYDLLICYECMQVEVFKDGKDIATLYLMGDPSDDYPKKLNDLLTVAGVPLSPN